MGPSAVGRKPDRLSAVAALACLVSSAGVASATGALPSPARVLALAERGLSGDFEATYKVSGQLAIFPGPEWTVDVAHEGQAPVSDPFITKGAVWSFFMHAVDGYQLQCIENGQHFEDCWTMPTRPGWHCGQGTYQASNGFSMATLPYIPATVFTGLQQGVPAEPPASQHLTVSQRDTSAFGRLTCLTSVSAAAADLPGRTTTRHPFSTTCFTARGLVASQHQWAEGTWDNLVLVQARPQAQASNFRPVSAIGRSSTLPPL